MAVQVLPTVPGPLGYKTAVRGLSLGDQMAVGESNGLPVYWVNGTLHQVPMSKYFPLGTVYAVNRFGLMVGLMYGGHTAPRAFRYWAGNSAVTWYPLGMEVVDINDAGRALGYNASAYMEDSLYEFGPGTTQRRKLTLPAGYVYYGGWGDPFDPSSMAMGINNAGYVVARAETITKPDRDNTYASFTWAPTTDEPRLVLPGPVELDTPPGSAPIERSSLAVTIDNRNRLVGWELVGGLPSSPMSWSSLSAKGLVATYVASDPKATDLHARFVAMSDRSGLVAGTAESTARWDAPYRSPEVAVVSHVAGAVTDLPRLAAARPSQAYAAQDDGRVGGSAEDRSGVQQPVIWTCAGAN